MTVGAVLLQFELDLSKNPTLDLSNSPVSDEGAEALSGEEAMVIWFNKSPISSEGTEVIPIEWGWLSETDGGEEDMAGAEERMRKRKG